MDKQIMLRRYQSARSTLLVATILSAINTVFMLVGLDYYLIYSLSIPVLAISIASEFFTSTAGIMIIIMFAIIPVLLLVISYLLSAKDYKWLTVSTVIFALDLLLIVAFEILISDISMIVDIIIKCLILYMMFAGIKAGKKLNNNFQEGTFEEQVDSSIKMYCYDSDLAKQNKTNKLWLFFLMTFGCLLAIVLWTVLIEAVSSSTVAVVLLVVLAIGCFGLWVYLLVKLAPFIDCKNVCYYKENDAVVRLSSGSMIAKTVLSNLLLVEEKSNCYICSYISETGKSQKIIIPKCYKDIDELFF